MIYFIHIEKAAGTTINESLKRLFGRQHCELFTSCDNEWIKRDDISFANKLHPFGLRSVTCHRLYPQKIAKQENDYFFTIIRDPIKRLISHYEYLHNTRLIELPTFKDWIELEENINFQLKKLSGKTTSEEGILQTENIDFIGVLEYFNASINAISKSNESIKFFNVEKNKSTTHNISQEILKNPEVLKKAQILNEEDIKFYNHFKTKFVHNDRKEYPFLDYKKRYRFRKYLHLINRNLVYKPGLRLRMLIRCKTLKINHQMSGLKSNWLGHFYPNLLIKINRSFNLGHNKK